MKLSRRSLIKGAFAALFAGAISKAPIWIDEEEANTDISDADSAELYDEIFTAARGGGTKSAAAKVLGYNTVVEFRASEEICIGELVAFDNESGAVCAYKDGVNQMIGIVINSDDDGTVDVALGW